MGCKIEPPRPKKWIELVVFVMTYFRGEHLDYRLALRRDYRRIAKTYGLKEAERYARKQAVFWFLSGLGVALKWTVQFGKRLIIS